MKKFTIQFVGLIIVILVAFLFYKGKAPIIPFAPQTNRQSIVSINDTKIKVDIADTKEKRTKGLGGREKLASDEGMLFVFERQDKYPFWMKGLKFPLDFIWIRDDSVVDIIQNAQIPDEGASDESLPIYLPREPIDKVLEVNTGVVDILKIKVGDTIKLE